MPSADISAIAYEELEGSPQEQLTQSGFTATRTLKCPWADRLTLAQRLLGGWLTIGGGTSYYTPYGYPGQPSAVVQSVSIGNFDERITDTGGDTTRASYGYGQLTVNYGNSTLTGDPDNADAPLFEESLEPYAEFLTLPAVGFKWGSTSGDALKDEEAPGKLFKGLNWVYSRPSVTNIPSAVLSLVGCVNSSALHSKSLGLDFAAETLLYNPPLLRRAVTADGSGAWSLEYRFSYKPQGWNRFWRAKTQAWDRIYTASGPADPYLTGDFTALI